MPGDIATLAAPAADRAGASRVDRDTVPSFDREAFGMRLVAFEFAGAEAPVASAYLELGDVTVLFGPNDVGKSRLLQTVADGARSLDLLIEGQARSGDHRFFVELGDEDADRLLSATYERYRAEAPDEVDEVPPTDGRAAWLDMAGEQRGQLTRSSLFALEALADWCGRPPGGPPGLLVSWCTALEPLAGPHSFGAGGTRIGTIDLPVLPVPVHVPSVEPGWLRRELAGAAGGWLAHLIWGLGAVAKFDDLIAGDHPSDYLEPMDDWLELAEGFARRVESRPPAADLWTVRDDDTGSVSYRPIATTACSHLGELATRLAPAFVKDRYRISVRPRGILQWQPQEPVVIELESVVDGEFFDHSALADGLRLWVEISLLEAADALRRAELRLRDALFAIEAADPQDPQALGVAARSYLQLLKETVESAVDPPFERTLGAALTFAEGVDSPSRDDFAPPQVVENLAAVRPRLYLLDEPERHLNPRLQRAAATWLVDLLRTRGSQGLIATHAPAFLNAGRDTKYVQVRRRHDGSSELDPFTPEDVTAYSEIAADVGLDRGELLGNVEVLLFVEGRHDQTVLETIFAMRFRRAGVVVVPIAGAGKHAQIVEHEVLIRFTRARLAIVLDKLDADVVRRLVGDEAFRHESLRSRQTELQAMASLLQNAAVNRRDVCPFALPVDDVFDALDEGIIEDQFPKYPGHDAARAAFAGQKKVSNRKRFYEERFGVANGVATYRRLAALMRSFDRVPDVLDDLASAVERFAFRERA